MAYRLTIDGVDQTDAIRRGPGFAVPTFELTRNLRSRLTFDVELEPDPRVEVISYGKDGTTPVVGGVLIKPTPLPQTDGAIVSRCEVVGFEVYTDWCYWTKTYTATKTLKQILTDLVADKLTAYSITLHASQVDGPSFTPTADAPLTWTKRRVSDVLRDLVEATGYMMRIDASKVLRMFAPGTGSGPVALSETLRNIGRATYTPSTQVPANTVICEFGPSGVGSSTIAHSWTADGVATTFSLEGQNVPASSVWPGTVTVGGVVYPIHLPGEAPGGNGIEWDYATDGGTLSFVGTASSLVPAATVVSLTAYYPQFPFTITKGSGSPPIEKLIAYPTITDFAFADLTSDQALDQLDQDATIYECTTLEDGFEPGQAISLDAPTAGIDAVTPVVTSVRAKLNTAEFWEYTITAEGGTGSLQADALTRLRRLVGNSSSGSVTGVVGASGGSSTVLSSPFPLGGSRTESQTVGTTRTPVIDWLPFVAGADMTVRVRVTVRARESGVTVTPYLEIYNSGTMAWDSHQAGSGALGASEAEQTFTAALTAGETYRLAYLTDTASASAYAIGQMENVT